MPKICKHPECNYPIWSRKSSYCKKHIYLFKDEKPKTVKVIKPLKSVSANQQKSNSKVSKAKANVLKNMLENYGYIFCESSGQTDCRLHCSHIIAIGKNKDLEADERNIVVQSHECHQLWEQKSLECKKFFNFADMMNRVKELDPQYYQKLKIKFEL